MNLRCAEKTFGSTIPVRGWFSESYGKLIPSPHVFYSYNRQSGVTGFLMTQNAHQVGLSMHTLLCEIGNILITIKDAELEHEIIVCNKRNKFIGSVNRPDFNGELIHIFKKSGTPVSVRAVGVFLLEWEEYDLKISEEAEVINIILDMQDGIFETVHSSRDK